MKKNKAPKLSLNKETLRSLEEGRMIAANGGAPTVRPGCTSKDYSYCDTCGIACTYDCTL